MIANRILEDSVNRHSHKAGLNHQSGSISIRLLVPHGQLGAVIGKSGSMIRQIQSETGTRIIASEQMLTNSTDRTVQISGVPENVCAAVKMIADVIESTFGTERASGHIPYKPVVHQHQHQYHNESGHHQKLMKSKLGSDQSFPDENTNSGGNQQDGGETTVQTQQIYVPDDMVGCVIGRAGVKINDIRRKSGSQIRIADATADSNERLVTITGTVEGNQRALLMVYACLEAENKRKEMLAAASTEAPEPLVETSH